MTAGTDPPEFPGPIAGRWPAATTRPVALLGWPVAHSLSPILHKAAFLELGLDLVYLALPTPPAALGVVVAALGAIGTVGANVTVPHKVDVVPLCDRLSDDAARVGAVNTLTWTAGELVGDNTDVSGFARVLRDDLAVAGPISSAVLGTGGAARAVVAALGAHSAAVTVVGRRPDAAAELARLAVTCGAAAATVAAPDDGDLERALERCDLVVNATPLGLQDEHLPAVFERLRPGQIAYDLVYRPAETPFLTAARRAGAEAHHGLGLLVAQVADSFRCWTGYEAPVATMSAAGLVALAERPNSRGRH